MKGGKKNLKKNPKIAGFYRSIVGANVRALLDYHYADLGTVTARKKKLQDESKIWVSTIERIISGESGASLDNLEAIASAFGVMMYQLMLPELDVKNPQVVQGASKIEQKAYARWRRAQQTETA